MGMQTYRTESRQPSIRADAISLLTADHENLKTLFTRFEDALYNHSPMLDAMATEICKELEIHSKIEEQIFYPAIAHEDSLQGLVDEAQALHSEVDAMVAELKGMSSADPQFGEMMLQLIEDVEDHIEEEEQQMFPLVEEQMMDELMDLGAQLLECRREVMSQIDKT